MLTHKGKQEMLLSLTEDDFRKEVLIPLLNKMHFDRVRERHGPEEYGKDITFRQPSDLGNTYYAVVAKIGDIGGSASGKANLATVQTQVSQAIDMPIDDVEEKQQYRVNRVIVWTTGKISTSAQKQIHWSATDRFRNIDFKDGVATIELLDKYYPGFFTIRDPYISDYYSGAKRFYSRLEELLTLGSSSDSHHLAALFVPPTFLPFLNRKTVSRTKFKKSDIKVFSFNQLLKMSHNVFVMGEAGSGKSTLLRRALIAIIEDNEEQVRRIPIPILIHFKRLSLDEDSPIEGAIRREFLRFSPTGGEQELYTDLLNGSVILLADGLDELQTDESIKKALELIKAFRTKHPSVRIIVSSRPMAILEEPGALSGFRALALAHFDQNQMTDLVQKWYGPENPDGRKVMRFLNSPGSLRGLPATPLTLVLVLILYENGREIPANLTELYQKYAELALGRWDLSRDIRLQFEWKKKELVLRKISWRMHTGRTSEMPVSEFDETVFQIGDDRGLAINAPLLRDEIVDRSELMFLNENDALEFKHRTFQGYFAGAELNSQAESLSLVTANFLDPWWAQTIFFAGGLKPDDESYLSGLMEKVTVPADKYVSYAMDLGALVQASYLVPRRTKQKAVELVLEMMTEAWSRSCERYQQWIESGRQLGASTGAGGFVVFLHAYMGQIALGSSTLSLVLAHLVDKYISQPIEGMSARDIAKREWHLFILALACAQCDNVDALEKIVSSEAIQDPTFRMWMNFSVDQMAGRVWLNETERNRIKKLAAALEPHVPDKGKYFLALLAKPPTPLPPAEASPKELPNGETNQANTK